MIPMNILLLNEMANHWDMSAGSEEGRKWAMSVVDRILGEYGAKWIKFDFNLDPAPGCDQEDHDHGKGDGLYAHYMDIINFLMKYIRNVPCSHRELFIGWFKTGY